MKDTQVKQNTAHKTSELSSVILDRIEEVTPDAKWKFACTNYFVWVAWAFSVVFGAVSVAVLIYVADHSRFALFEATHDTPISFFTEIFPLIWIGTFIAMGTFAYFNMKHTKCGYRYPMWQLLISSVAFSLVGGAILHIFGTGYLIDTQLAKRMPIYTSLERTEQHMWQKPEEGRLLGVFNTMDEKDEMYVFVDSNNTQWQIQTVELRDRDRLLLSSGDTVRVLGTTTNRENNLFHACGVFPWMYDRGISMRDMKKDRQQFVERMYEHMEKGDRLKKLEREVFEKNTDMPFGEGLCAEISVMKRMKF